MAIEQQDASSDRMVAFPEVQGRRYERDIDVLLAEEFAVCPEFAAWFLKQTSKFMNKIASVKSVSISKSDSLGESDLVVVFMRGNAPDFALFIEDKIDAQLQPNQLERYRRRAQVGVEKREYCEFEVVLCAPDIYRDTHESDADLFDSFISYEAIGGFLRSRDPRDPRGAYRANFILKSIPTHVSAWVRIEDEITDRFWKAAYELAHSEFRELNMKPLRLTKNETWINFRTQDMPTMPQRIYVSFKGDRGHMDLTFSNTRDDLMYPMLKPILEAGMDLVQTGNSAAVRLRVDGLTVCEPDHGTQENLRVAFAACVRLVEFFRKHREFLIHSAAESCPVV